MDKTDKNRLLLTELREWYYNVLMPFVDEETNDGEYRCKNDADKWWEGTQLSCPFCFGLNERYKSGAYKKIMLVGQEARGFGNWKEYWKGKKDLWESRNTSGDKWLPKELQLWANNYLNKQLKLIEKDDIKYNASPFWNFFRALHGLGNIAICWDNLDKVYYGYNDGEDGTLTYEAEVILSKQFGVGDNKLSLLQREIKIADPDMIIFVVGPSYAVSLDVAFNITKNIEDVPKNKLFRKSQNVSKLFINYPKKDKCIVEDNDLLIGAVKELLGREIPVLWTYHPAGLCRNGLTNSAIKIISDNISKIM